MKIAVCLSGQPRSIEYTSASILNHFSGNHSYDFFCHSWNYNTWKRKDDAIYWGDTEIVDDTNLTEHILKFKPKKFLIQSKHDLPHDYPWFSLFYSMMMANHLKKCYEIENDFRYDIVIKSRFDVICYPNTKFDPPSEINDLDFYCLHNGRMMYEYQRINDSDIIFFGTSLGMDILCDVYRKNHYSDFTPSYYSGFAARGYDFEALGPGVLIDQYASSVNMRSYTHPLLSEIIYRKEMIPLDPIEHFAEFVKNNASYYI